MPDRDSVIEALEQAIPFMRVKGYGAVALIMHDALELLKEQPNAVQCKDCKYWGKKSSLTARKCSRQGIITGQFDFCSYGRTVKQNDSN